MKIANPFTNFTTNRDISFGLLCAYCLFAANSIAATRIVVVPLLLLWLVRNNLHNHFAHLDNTDGVLQKIRTPIFLWLLLCFIASALGVDFHHSIEDVIKTSLYFLFPFTIVSLCNSYQIEIARQKLLLLLSLLCLGQGFAALNTTFSAAITELDLDLPGPVTESGQLVLVLPILWAILRNADSENTNYKTMRTIATALIITALMIVSWQEYCFPENSTAVSIIAALTIFSAMRYLWRKRINYSSIPLIGNSFLLSCLAILTTVALIVNLKRGPWIGVTLELIILGLLLSRKLLLTTIIVGAFALTLPPVQSRILDSGAHFQIVGGRQVMWSLGIELAQRFPLGLGIENAQYMQKLDPLIPSLHRHMHSNLLNVLVETGWLGLAAYIWLFWTIAKLGYLTFLKLKEKHDFELAHYVIAITVALIGWQAAGTVEYNYGDGEIRMITLFLLGILLYCARLAHNRRHPEL